MLTIINTTDVVQYAGTSAENPIFEYECSNTCFWSLNDLTTRKNPNCGCLKDNKKKSEYGIWCDIKKRCYNKNSHAYNRYGGRGIKMCDDWKNSFKNFYMWVKTNIGLRPGPEYSLDRLNNDGNYEPGNIRWATTEEQNQNQRQNKFTKDDVKQIREEFKNTTEKTSVFIARIAKKFKANIETVRQLIHYKTWKNI